MSSIRYRGKKPLHGISDSEAEQSIREDRPFGEGTSGHNYDPNEFEDIELNDLAAEGEAATELEEGLEGALEAGELAETEGSGLGELGYVAGAGIALGGTAWAAHKYHQQQEQHKYDQEHANDPSKDEVFNQWKENLAASEHAYDLTLPGHNYLGPGNKLDKGPPTNQIDQDAQEHDHAYNDAQSQQDIKDADHKFIGQAGDHIAEGLSGHGSISDTIGAVIGGAGIGIKDKVENQTGVKYPSGLPDKKPMAPPNKRPAGNSKTDKVPAKKPLQRHPTDPNISSTGDNQVLNDTDVDMPLTGTGQEQASGGADSSGQQMYIIERPFTNFGMKESVYTKVHKLMSLAFAPAIISTGPNSQIFLTTHLAEVPWELPVFYLTPSEFALMEAGTRVKEVHIDITYRGSVIQFEIGATTSGLATLNQINDITCAVALNKTSYGLNVAYTGTATDEPMVPNAIDKPMYTQITGSTVNYRGLEKQYYGTTNPLYLTDKFIPHHNMGIQSWLRNYFAIATRAASPPSTATLYGGIPDIANKYIQLDGKTVCNQSVLKTSYKPKMGFIKTPLKHYAMGCPVPLGGSERTIVTNGEVPQMYSAQISHLQQTGVESSISQVTQSNNLSSTNQNANINALTNIYTPIEKSQITRSGVWGQQHGHVQPSVHIGVNPIPALNSTEMISDQYHKWTDARGYWEVKATMITVSQLPTDRPYATEGNVAVGDAIHTATTVPPAMTDYTSNGTLFAGLMQQESPNFVTPFAARETVINKQPAKKRDFVSLE